MVIMDPWRAEGDHIVSGPLSFPLPPSTVERGQEEAVIYSHKGVLHMQRRDGTVWASQVTMRAQSRGHRSSQRNGKPDIHVCTQLFTMR